ncbi:hypothetical protein GPALN_013084 [Globodera pallida]|nr:hypothetical protein GPALN_013084 [Globodera pallida]
MATLFFKLFGDMFIYHENLHFFHTISILHSFKGSHCCSTCKMPCHAICGDSGEEEGYGAHVVCFNCKKSVETKDRDKDDDESQLHDDDDGIPSGSKTPPTQRCNKKTGKYA